MFDWLPEPEAEVQVSVVESIFFEFAEFVLFVVFSVAVELHEYFADFLPALYLSIHFLSLKFAKYLELSEMEIANAVEGQLAILCLLYCLW